jgi:hypothetical protein
MINVTYCCAIGSGAVIELSLPEQRQLRVLVEGDEGRNPVSHEC